MARPNRHTTRVYCVSNGDTQTLVRTSTPARALHAVNTSAYTVRVATQDDMERVLSAGGAVLVVPPSPVGRKAAEPLAA